MDLTNDIEPIDDLPFDANDACVQDENIMAAALVETVNGEKKNPARFQTI